MPAGLGVPELIIILFIVLILFGAGRIAEIGASLGKGIREFRRATSEEDPKPKASTDEAREARTES